MAQLYKIMRYRQQEIKQFNNNNKRLAQVLAVITIIIVILEIVA